MSYLSAKEFYQLNTPEEDRALLKKILDNIGRQIRIDSQSASHHHRLCTLLRKFNMLKGYRSVSLVASYTVGHTQPFHLAVLAFESELTRITQKRYLVKENIVEYEFVGIASLKTSYPTTYLRPENWSDKLNEWLQPQELDFAEAPQFSKKYYLLTEDEAELRKKIRIPMLQAIGRYSGLEMEIREHTVLVRCRSRISEAGAVKLVNLLSRLNDGSN